MTDLSRLTLVTPTYGRQRYALRSMQFWSGSDVQLLVLDGSPQPIPQKDLAGIAKNVRYEWMPISLEERLRTSTSLVETEFVTMLSDDEFYLEGGLEACISYLDAHSDTVAAIGRCANFWPSRCQIMARQRYPQWRSLIKETPHDRVIDLGELYEPSSVYAVTRREQWVLSQQAASMTRFASPYAIELILMFMVNYMGKIKVLDELMWLRSGENHPVNLPGRSLKLEFHQWYDDKRFQDEVDNFFQIMSEKLASFYPLVDKQETRSSLRAALGSYAGGHADNEGFIKSIKVLNKSILVGIAARLPKNIKYPIKKILGFSKGQMDIQELPAFFQQRNIGVDVKSLNRVIGTLKSFYA